MCFVNLIKAFNRVIRKMLEWAMRKKGMPEFLVKSVMRLYEGAKTEELQFIVGMHQGSVLSPSIFAVVVEIVT